MIRPGFLALLALSLGACSSGSTPAEAPAPTPDQAFDAAVLSAADMNAALPLPTTFPNLPASGSAVFEGPALVTLTDGNREPAFAGSAELRADFGQGTLSGVMTDFLYAAQTDETGAAGPVRSAAGNLTISPGAIVPFSQGQGEARGLRTENLVTGVLVADGQNYRFGQNVEGVLYGNPDPRAVVMAGDGTVGIGTRDVPASILIVAD
ncbi:hypothetical protein ACXN5S_05990 [Pseudoroseicyclus sp. H15]